jgi:Reverse transcriptase (RNA-dependent DNA polymerase)
VPEGEVSTAPLAQLLDPGRIRITKPTIPDVMDTTGTGDAVTLSTLEIGVKTVILDERTHQQAIEEATQALGATTKRSSRGDITMTIPPQKERRVITGSIIGIPLRPGDENFRLQGKTITVPSDEERRVEVKKRKLKHCKFLAAINRMRQQGVFKKADKGSTIVYMTKAEYVEGAEKHLNTANYATATTEDEAVGINQATDFLKRAAKEKPKAYDKLFGKVNIQGTRERWIYFQPKIHKGKQSDGGWKWRPIVDCKNTDLSELDAACAQFCKRLLNKMRTIANSTIDVLRKLRKIATLSGLKFMTADVADLYTNVPIQEGVDAVFKLLQENNIGTADERVLTKEALEIVFRNNVFNFGERKFKQLHGVPMGSNSAPIVADAFLFLLERQLVEKQTDIEVFSRYRDDILVVASNGKSIKLLIEEYGKLHPRIKIEAETGDKVTFLDLRLTQFDNRQLRVGWYTKPTDSLKLLSKDSEHPRHVFRGITEGKITTLFRCCNNYEDWANGLASLIKQNTGRGYRYGDWMKAIDKVCTKLKSQAWPFVKEEVEETRDYRTTTLCTYARDLDGLYDIMRKRNIKFANKEGKNLQRLLCRSADPFWQTRPAKSNGESRKKAGL